MIITIDGPVASGKSTVAKAIAKELGIYYLYTGLLYRVIGFVLLEKLKTKEALIKFLDEITNKDLIFLYDVAYDYSDGEPHLFYKETDITSMLLDSKYDQIASIVGANKIIRDALLGVQRGIARYHDVVADGRDCGTVVFPDAQHKIFLTASLDVRAQRVALDRTRGETEVSLEKVKAELEQRDKRDMQRDVAPLIIPEGAVVVDSSHLTF